ncbi:MAG: hypothetical protein U0800_17655 [Isosphaeraceae bacterium]
MNKAGIFYTGSGPVLILTTHDSLNDPGLVEKLQAKGIAKYMAFEVPVEDVKKKYGPQFTSVMNDLKQQDDLRVMDFDGRRIFQLFSFQQMGKPIIHEE